MLIHPKNEGYTTVTRMGHVIIQVTNVVTKDRYTKTMQHLQLEWAAVQRMSEGFNKIQLIRQIPDNMGVKLKLNKIK